MSKAKALLEADATKREMLDLLRPDKVWIVTVQYPTDEGGSSVALPSKTKAGAWAKLADYCRHEWEYQQQEADEDDPLPPLPADNSAAIDAFFEHVTRENYTIQEYDLED